MEGLVLKIVAIAALASALAGCLKKLPAFNCSDDTSCGAGGVCEADGLCSFADAECSSGRRYGDQSGPASNQCVGGGPPTDASTDAPPDTPTNCPNDVDCDNVVDGDDNCMTVQNEDQFDEDNDGRGNVCDICPPFADNNEDADGDDLGDACDPHPNTMGDVLVEFAGFEVMPAGWVADGSFTVANGFATGISGVNASPVMLVRPAPQAANYTIWAKATLDDISGASLGAIGLTAMNDLGTDGHVLCQVVGEAGGAQQELRMFDTGSGFVQLDSAAHQFPEGLTFELFFEKSGTFYACDATNPAASVAGTTSFAPSGPHVGLRTRNATSRYHWVMIIRSP